MRSVVFALAAVVLAGCGLALDFDPADPDAGPPGIDGGPPPDLGERVDLGTGDAGRPRIDGGGRDLGPLPDLGPPPDLGMAVDLGIDAGPSVDLGVPDDGVVMVDASVGDAGAPDSGIPPGSCFTSAECRVAAGEFCQTPDGMCGAMGFCAARPGGCTAVFAPVCSCAGVDFSNSCLAHVAGENVAYDGMCATGTTACDFVTTLVRGCTSDTNCAVAIHQSDCCGDTVAIGINHSELTRFMSLEPACDASYPSCGCPTGPTITDSGETTFDPSAVMVGCVARGPTNVCLTYVTMRPPDGP